MDSTLPYTIGTYIKMNPPYDIEIVYSTFEQACIDALRMRKSGKYSKIVIGNPISNFEREV